MIVDCGPFLCSKLCFLVAMICRLWSIFVIKPDFLICMFVLSIVLNCARDL